MGVTQEQVGAETLTGFDPQLLSASWSLRLVAMSLQKAVQAVSPAMAGRKGSSGNIKTQHKPLWVPRVPGITAASPGPRAACGLRSYYPENEGLALSRLEFAFLQPVLSWQRDPQQSMA